MKFFKLVALIFSFLLLNNCSRSNENENSCSNVSGFSVTQKGDVLNFTISSSLEGPFEIKYIDLNRSTVGAFIVNDKVFSKNINDIYIQGKVYTFEIRRVCSSSSNSDWGFKNTITISNNFCKSPTDLNLNPYYNEITWEIGSTYSNGINPSYYQVQYGLQGFSLGSGIIIDTNNKYYYASLVGGKKYDLYVRSFCSGSASWGDWVGPTTVLASITTGCVAPTYASSTVKSISSSLFGVNLSWENDGISDYQISLSESSSLPSSNLSTITAPNGAYVSGLIKGRNYYFYVRKVCSNNKYSEYYGPYLIKWN